MKKIVIMILLTLSGHSVTLFAQSVGINAFGNQPDSNAILDIDASDKGVLFPRTTPANIISPVDGLIIYDTADHVFKYYDGMVWQAIQNHESNTFWFADQDGDGYGFPFNVIYSPEPPEFYVANNDDCNDEDPDIHEAGIEVCDSIDNDCDGLIDDADPDITGLSVFYYDMDGDGFGNSSLDTMTCFLPEGYVDNGGDCDDTDPNINPDATEICDGIDNNCNALIDEDDPALEGILVYPDNDGDLFGADVPPDTVCVIPNGYIDNNLDCDDMDDNIYPGAPELCDGIDNDCDPMTEGEDDPLLGTPCDGPDADFCEEGVWECNSGSLVCNDMTGDNEEICGDGIDNNCDGTVDEGCIAPEWGNVQFPFSTSTDVNVPTELIFGWVYAMGATDLPGQYPGFQAQLGYGPDNSDPTGGDWIWVDAVYNTDVNNNDEYQATLTIGQSGTYDYAYRYSGDNGVTWLYADTGDGSLDGYDPADAGDLTVNP